MGKSGWLKSFKPISTSLSPNTQKDDVFLAWKLLFQPWRWRGKFAFLKLEEQFKQYLGINYAFSFNSGRSALMAILYALNIKKNDEVLIQAFTCNAVPNSIIWSGLKPVYVDIDETLNIDPEDLEKKITPKSKAIILQHTFGLPAQIDKILTIAECYNLKIIEDCAHSLGAEFNGQKVGTIGDISFFSFGRDKIISSVFGGIVATNNPELAKNLKEFQEKCNYPSKFWIFQQLLHPIIFSIALPTYYLFNFGKFLIWFCQKLKLLSRAVTKEEKKEGKNPDYFPKRLPDALAILGLNQLKKIESFNEHRRKIAKFYQHNLNRLNFRLVIETANNKVKSVYWKYPVLMENANKIRKIAKKNHIFLDDGWWGSPIMPPDTNLEKMNYQPGSCSKAEKIAQNIINLPTHINLNFKDAQKIVTFLKNFIF